MTALQIVTEILRWSYLALVGLYAGLGLAVILNVVRQLTWRLRTRWSGRSDPSVAANPYLVSSERFFLRNIAALFLLLWLPIAALALLPLPESMNWWLLPMIVSGVSYLSGWRAANFGVIVGSVGVTVGLWLFAALDAAVVWWDAAPLFLVLNLLGNVSGWLGSFIGRGQIREAQCLTRITLRLAGQGASLYRVIDEIDPIVTEVFRRYWPTVERVEGSTERLMLAECDNPDCREGAIVALSEQVRWIHKYAPIVQGLRWIVERPIQARTINEISTHIFNVWRYATCYVALTRDWDVDEPPDVFSLIVKSYWEIPAIVFVDDKMAAFARELHSALLTQLQEHCSPERQVLGAQFLVFRSWQLRPLAEQVVLQTWGATQPRDAAVRGLQLASDVDVPADLVADFLSASTFFDRWRGTTATLVFFALSQILLGILVDYFKDVLEQLA